MGFREALDINQTLRGRTGQFKCEKILKEVLPWETFSQKWTVFYFQQIGGMESQWLGRSTACYSLDPLCIWIPSFRGACPSTDRPCHAFNLISATSPLLRREALLSVKEYYHSILERHKRRNQSWVDEWSRSEYSFNLSNCRASSHPSLPQVCIYCQPCPKDQQH